MDERIAKLRTSKDAEVLTENAERLGNVEIANQARARAIELRETEKASRRRNPVERKGPKRSVGGGKIKERAEDEALFMNGVFEGVLKDIVEAQALTPGLMCYLQPYKPALIRRLKEAPPTPEHPWKLFMSLTQSLGLVSFEADIVEWHDKASLGAEEVAALDAHISAHQPREKGVHLEAGDGDYGRNLIGIVSLRRLDPPLVVAGFKKISDDLPLRDRTRAGGWSYVMPPASTSDFEVFGDAILKEDESKQLSKSLARDADERQARLEVADPVPAQIFVVSKAFRRNQDVVAEVLKQAEGHCQDCHLPAPFLRARDGTPFLEVHHIVTLAQGGLDTVDNAIALCPNCHRKRHFGQLV